MKYKNLMIRAMNLLLIVLLLAGYQTAIYVRGQQLEIAKLKTEVNQLQGERDDIMNSIKEDLGGEGLSDEDLEAEALYNDGTYQGTAEGYGGPITVEVKIEGGRITAVEITEAKGEDQAYMAIVKKTLDDIVLAQGTDVDAVSGATCSSDGIINAAKQALEGAKR